MRTLLRDTATGLYVTGVEAWTRDPDQAYNFVTGPRAIKFAVDKHLEKAELVFSFPDPAYDIHIPLERAS